MFHKDLACTQTLFYFFFVLFEDIGERASKTSAERQKEFSSCPTTTPLRWRSINPLPSIFYHPRSTDFEEKKKGL